MSKAIFGRLAALVEVGRRNSSADGKLIQAIHDSASNLGATCMTTEAERAPLDMALLTEAMSFNEITQELLDTIRTKLNVAPGGVNSAKVWVWMRDVYPDYCIYSVDDGEDVDLFRQSYMVVNG